MELPLYINFIDYEKAFDIVDRETLWKLMRHYGVPEKSSPSFEVKTGVREGCLLPPFVFLLVFDWIMKITITGKKNGIQWTLWSQLDDLDFADNLALLSHNHNHMQDHTTQLSVTSLETDLRINKEKTKLMRIKTLATIPVSIDGKLIKEVDSFTYLGNIIDKQGGTYSNVTARVGKARAVFIILKNIWASREIITTTKLRIFNSNVKSVLLYG